MRVDKIAPRWVIGDIASRQRLHNRRGGAKKQTATLVGSRLPCVLQNGVSHATIKRHTSMTMAIPMPPPMHRLATPRPPPRFRSA